MDLETRIKLTEDLLVDLKAQLVREKQEARDAKRAGVDGLADAARSALEALKVTAGDISPALAKRALDGVLRDAGIQAPTPDPFHTVNKD